MAKPIRIADPGSERQAPAVNATGIGTTIATPARNPDLEMFVKGMQQYVGVMQGNFEETAREDLEAGRSARKSGMTEQDAKKKSRTFIEGYMYGGGEAAAIRDAEELRGLISTEWDQTKVGLDKYISDFYSSKMKGAQPDEFSRGYNRVFGEQMQGIRQKDSERVANEIVSTQEANAAARINYAFQRRLDLKIPMDMDLHDEINEIAKDMRIDPKRKDEMIFIALKKFSDNGDSSVWEFTKAPRKDQRTGGTFPSMYDNPAWKAKIDVEERQSEDRYLAKNRQRRIDEKSEREDRQEAALRPIALAIAKGDVATVDADLNRLFEDESLFPNAGAMLQWKKLIRTEASAAEKPGEQLNFTKHLQDIYAGRLSLKQIPELTDVGPTIQRQLLSEWYRVDDRRKQAAREARVADAQIRSMEKDAFTDPVFKSAAEFVDRALSMDPNQLDKFVTPEAFETLKQDRAQLQLQFYQWRSQNLQASREQINEYAQSLVDRGQKNLSAAREKDFNQPLPYSSVRDLVEAEAKGLVPPATFMSLYPRLKARESQSKPQPK